MPSFSSRRGESKVSYSKVLDKELVPEGYVLVLRVFTANGTVSEFVIASRPDFVKPLVDKVPRPG